MPEPSTRRRDGAAQAEVERAHALQQQHVRGSAAGRQATAGRERARALQARRQHRQCVSAAGGRQAKVQHGHVFCMRSVL